MNTHTNKCCDGIAHLWPKEGDCQCDCHPNTKENRCPHGVDGTDCVKCFPSDTKENDGRCSQCKLEGNNGICDRKDCSGFTKKNEGWEEILESKIKATVAACPAGDMHVEYIMQAIAVHTNRLLTTQRKADRDELYQEMNKQMAEQYKAGAKFEREKVIELVRGMKYEFHVADGFNYSKEIMNARIDAHNAALEAIIEKLQTDI